MGRKRSSKTDKATLISLVFSHTEAGGSALKRRALGRNGLAIARTSTRSIMRELAQNLDADKFACSTNGSVKTRFRSGGGQAPVTAVRLKALAKRDCQKMMKTQTLLILFSVVPIVAPGVSNFASKIVFGGWAPAPNNQETNLSAKWCC